MEETGFSPEEILEGVRKDLFNNKGGRGV